MTRRPENDVSSATGSGRNEAGNTMNEIVTTSEFHKFVEEIDSRIQQARISASLAVNKALLQLYWDIGREIVKRQEQYGRGKSVVEELARELQERNGKATGFSARNLWRMRNFYESFPDQEILPPAVAEISWSKLYAILEMGGPRMS